MTFLTLTLAAFAAYRAAQMIAFEDGPVDIFARWRDWIRVEKQSNWLQRGFACPDCVSFWASAAAVALLGLRPWNEFLLAWGAVAGVCLLLNRLTKKLTE